MSKKMQIRVALALVFVSVLAFAGYQLLGQQPQLQTQAVTKFWAMIIDNNKDQVALTVQGYSTQTSSLFVAEQSDGTDVWTVSNAGVTAQSGGTTFTLPATGLVVVDGDTTNQTQIAGVVDINVGSVTADVSGLNIAATQDNGTVAATDMYAVVVTLTQNDADGDMRGIKIDAASTANATTASYEYGLTYDCAEATAASCTDGILLTSSGIDTGMTDAIDVSDTEIVNAMNLGDNDVAVTNNFNLKNATSGSVIFNFRDYADTTDDDMAHAVLTANCTTATTGAEDCDLTIGVVEGGAAAETRLNLDADGGITIGSANNDSINLTTDGTGDAELVVPNDSIATAEILDNSITFTDISASSAVDTDTTFTMADGIELVLQPSYTIGDVEGLLIDINQVDDAVATDDVIAFKIEATSESGDAGDTIRGIVVNFEEGSANTIMDAALAINNLETTAATMTDAIIVTSSGVNLGVTDAIDVSADNILNAINVGSNWILGGNSDMCTVGATDAAFTFTRNNTGAVTYSCADDDANAECIFAGGGTGISTLGTTSNVSAQVLTDGTGDAELAVPENSIGPDELAVMVDQVIFCGQADEAGTIYYGPATEIFLGVTNDVTYTLSGVSCDALDNATEATVDAPLFTNVAFKVLGMYCKQSGTLGAGEAVTFTMRSAAADTTPVISCIISVGETDCRSLTGSTTDIAAGATVAVKAVQSGDNADDDHWCKVYIAYK